MCVISESVLFIIIIYHDTTNPSLSLIVDFIGDDTPVVELSGVTSGSGTQANNDYPAGYTYPSRKWSAMPHSNLKNIPLFFIVASLTATSESESLAGVSEILIP